MKHLGLYFQYVITRHVKPHKQGNVLCIVVVALSLLLNVNVNLISL